MVKRDLQLKWLQSKPKERLHMQNLYVLSGLPVLTGLEESGEGLYPGVQ